MIRWFGGGQREVYYNLAWNEEFVQLVEFGKLVAKMCEDKKVMSRIVRRGERDRRERRIG